jgi:hypothetical protein
MIFTLAASPPHRKRATVLNVRRCSKHHSVSSIATLSANLVDRTSPGAPATTPGTDHKRLSRSDIENQASDRHGVWCDVVAICCDIDRTVRGVPRGKVWT